MLSEKDIAELEKLTNEAKVEFKKYVENYRAKVKSSVSKDPRVKELFPNKSSNDKLIDDSVNLLQSIGNILLDHDFTKGPCHVGFDKNYKLIVVDQVEKSVMTCKKFPPFKQVLGVYIELLLIRESIRMNDMMQA